MWEPKGKLSLGGNMCGSKYLGMFKVFILK